MGDLSQNLGDRSLFEHHVHSQTSLSSAPWNLVGAVDQGLNAKIDAAGVPIGNILAIGQGMQTGLNEVFGNRTLKEINDWNVPEGMSFRRASNTDIQRYEVRDRREYLLYLEEVHDFAALPKGIQVYLKKHEPGLKERAAFLRGNCLWWQYTWPLHKEWYGRPKIYCPYLAKINRFALDRERAYIGLTDTTVLFENGQTENLCYLLGLLNSRLLTYRFNSIGKLKSAGIREFFWNGVSRLPIRRIDFSDPADKYRHHKMVEMVEEIQALHKQLNAANNEHERTVLSRQIEATDRQIDRLVYELYNLTDEEIATVEKATAKRERPTP